MTDHLFVYGTLMRAAARSALGREQRALLEREATLVGEATVPGRLFARPRYPVMTGPDPLLLAGSRDRSELVHGEVWQLAKPARVLAVLDPYESIPPGTTSGREYARVVGTATLADGRRVETWLYLCIADVAALPRIADGRWRPR